MKLKKVYLIFVQLAIFVLLLSLGLESNDDKTNEDVDHEEGDDDNVDEVIDGDEWTVVVYRAGVRSMGVD